MEFTQRDLELNINTLTQFSADIGIDVLANYLSETLANRRVVDLDTAGYFHAIDEIGAKIVQRLALNYGAKIPFIGDFIDTITRRFGDNVYANYLARLAVAATIQRVVHGETDPLELAVLLISATTINVTADIPMVKDVLDTEF